jgi:flavin reductase (DIM6/NTAB) family NADH-FMN oxidoreductase RutF
MAVAPAELRAAMARFATGVTVLTTVVDGRVECMTANAVTSVSLDPPLILVSVSATCRWRFAARAAGTYSVHVLAADQTELARWCASPSRHDDPTLLPVLPHRPHATVRLRGALATLDATMYAEYPAGDHDLLVGEVVGTEVAEGGHPLVFADHGFGSFAPARGPLRAAPVEFPVDDPFPGWTTPVRVYAAS